MSKKVVIQSDSNDVSTDDVISWVRHLSPTIKIESFLNNYNVDTFNLVLKSSNAEIVLNDKSINIKDSFWYRRGKFLTKRKENSNKAGLINMVQNENLKPLVESLNYGFNRKHINKFQDNQIEKLEMLFVCHKLSIPFPDTIVSNNEENILSFLDEHKKIISKGIKYPNIIYHFNGIRSGLASATLMIKEKREIINANPFSPSLFQEYIEKQIEIRSFYLNGKFKSMAIFSQQNEKTEVDYRHYDYERPNRLVPFKLPDNYEKKLDKLMRVLELNSGSFDIIYTPGGKYYFLEVNPIGQFQWLSNNCNYFLERMIAKELVA